MLDFELLRPTGTGHALRSVIRSLGIESQDSPQIYTAPAIAASRAGGEPLTPSGGRVIGGWFQ